jgi:MFS transporter, UMF1 family
VSLLKDRKIWAWAMYDFANSAFATTVLSVVFNVYFAKKVVPPEGLLFLGTAWTGTALWSGLVSLSMVFLFGVSPLLGATADLSGRKKPFLFFFWALGCAGSAGLFFAGPGDVLWASACFLTANIGFSGGNVFYNALIIDLATPASMGRASGFGWAVGYLGGGLCLALNLLMVKFPDALGIPTGNDFPIRACFLTVAVWWFVFGLPLFLTRFSRAAPAPRKEGVSLFKQGWSRLADTARHLGEYRRLLHFLAAYLLYNDGIETVILMASLVGAELLGMRTDELILCFLMIQGVAFIGAMIFGELADRWGHKRSIFLAVGVFAAAVVWGAGMSGKGEFWVLGVVVGLVLGGSQAASRSLMGLLTPAEKSAEFFSFYSLVSKFTAVLGPAVFGLARQFLGIRAAVLSLLVFFITGGFAMIFVKEPAAAKN